MNNTSTDTNQLTVYRSQISEIDRQMAALFEQRMKICASIAEYKQSCGLSVRDYTREKEMIDRNRKLIEDPEIESYYVRFLRSVVDLSCALQEQKMQGMKVAYSGVEGAFAYIAARQMFPTARLDAQADFATAYRSVENGDVDCCVLPLENSSAGEVGTVMDLLFSGSLFVNQVLDLPVRHQLLGCPGASLKDIHMVISHPQALSQCSDYLNSHGFETQDASNTALAAKQVLELGDPTIAAIASDETARIFGLEILDSNIQDTDVNTTRFAAFSRVPNRPVSPKKREDEHFILVFTVKNEAGALAQTLNIIGAHGFNMRSLRSRPMKNLSWRYYFYLEAEGNIYTENGQDMLRELGAICARLQLAGTYYSFQEMS